MSKQGPYRLVHLSDLHLTGKESGARTELGVFKPLKGMNGVFRELVQHSAVQQADCVLVTGDVTDRGDLEAWQVFWSAVCEAKLEDRIFIVPGNHDVCCLGVRLPGKRKAYRRADLLKASHGLRMGQQETRYPLVFHPDPRLVIFGLNSNNLGNMNVATNALGSIGYFQLASLASKLHRCRDVPVKIITLHHSPNIPGKDTARKRGQRPMSKLERLGHQIHSEHRHALLLLCIAHRVRLLLHGHLHLAEDRKVSGVRIVGAPASTEPVRVNRLDRGYQIYGYTIHGNGGRVRCQLKTVRLSC